MDNGKTDDQMVASTLHEFDSEDDDSKIVIVEA